ncbi:MAG: aldo/keto reductase [Elusimicrobia bacterium]|nr:aldo/keto reductase [Elusimicrobiota bacterium]
MRYRTFGKTGLTVSEIGYGGWGIGKSWWGETDDNLSRRALHRALDLGVTFFDTAYVYGDGHSERLIGSVLKERRAQAGVATKIPPKNWGWPASPATPLKDAFPADWIRACTERSLKNLGREPIDLQQFHVWTDAWLADDSWKEAIRELKQAGKIRFFGVSINDHQPESALQLVASGLCDSVQVIYNIFDQTPAHQLFPLCQQHNVGVIVRVPLDEGGLTGTLTPTTTFEEGDFRKGYFAGGRLQEACERVERLRFLIRGETRTLARAALKFCLAHPAVSTVIPGMRRPQHVEDNVAASNGDPLPPEDLQRLKAHAWPRNFYN